MRCFDIECFVCGGPHESGAGIRGHQELIESLKDQEWLHDTVGIAEDNVPRQLGWYSSHGTFDLPLLGVSPPENLATFHGKTSHNQCPALYYYDEDMHGLTCHTVCYHFLLNKLQYKLQFQDIWPLLTHPTAVTGVSEMVNDNYGGMICYQGQVWLSLMRAILILTACCNPQQEYTQLHRLEAYILCMTVCKSCSSLSTINCSRRVISGC